MENSAKLLKSFRGKFFLAGACAFAVFFFQVFPVWAASESSEVKKLNRKVLQLYRFERYKEAIPLAVQSYKLIKIHWGDNHPRVLMALNNLAELKRKTGHYAEAEALLLRSLKISARSFGMEHPSAAILLSNLALLYENMGNVSRAESLYQRSLKLKKRELGPNHPKVEALMDRIAALKLGIPTVKPGTPSRINNPLE